MITRFSTEPGQRGDSETVLRGSLTFPDRSRLLPASLEVNHCACTQIYHSIRDADADRPVTIVLVLVVILVLHIPLTIAVIVIRTSSIVCGADVKLWVWGCNAYIAVGV